MSPTRNTRIMRLTVKLLLVTFLACKGKEPVTRPAPSPNVSAATSTESTVGERRIALVVGNSQYRYVSYLKNPRNDAILIARSLKNVGFELVGGGPQLNLNKVAFDHAVQDFGNTLQGATTALFYYAGHGIETNGSNYLVPTSANPTRESDVDFQMVDVETILHQMEDGGARLNIVILDACRNNPFGGRGLRALGGGLGQMQAPAGTLISYAAQPRAVAMDGEGDHSPYSESLAAVISQPGVDIIRTFNQVGLFVKQQTGGKQEPWLSISPLEGDFYFVKAIPTPVVTAPAKSTLAGPPFGGGADADVIYWLSIGNTQDPEFLKSYLKQFPSGRFADIAKLRLRKQRDAAAGLTTPGAIPEVAVNGPPSHAPTSERFYGGTEHSIERVNHLLGKSGQKTTTIQESVGEPAQQHPLRSPAALALSTTDDTGINIKGKKVTHREPPKPITIPTDGSVNKVAPTPTAGGEQQMLLSRPPGKGPEIEFSSEPEAPGKSNPKSYGSASYYDRGNAFFAANNLDAATAQFRKAVDLDPTNADAYYAWGLTLYAKHDLAGSIANFEKATNLNSKYANAYYNWGLALYDLGAIPDAISKFKKTVELRPSYADAYYNWGLALSRTGALDRAINKFEKATSLNPKYADAYYGWGVALYHEQRFDESIAKYREALDLSPANQTYKMALSSALTAQQNSERH